MDHCHLVGYKYCVIPPRLTNLNNPAELREPLGRSAQKPTEHGCYEIHYFMLLFPLFILIIFCCDKISPFVKTGVRTKSTIIRIYLDLLSVPRFRRAPRP